MPFKSKAQRRKFYAMADRGEIPKKTVKKWEKHTKDKDLPEHKKDAEALRMLKIGMAVRVVRRKMLKQALLPDLRRRFVSGKDTKVAAPKPTLGKAVGGLGQWIGKVLGLAGKGGYASRSGVRGKLRQAGSLKGLAHPKANKAVTDELARRQRLLGYGTTGAGLGAAGLGGHYLSGDHEPQTLGISPVIYPGGYAGAPGGPGFDFSKFSQDKDLLDRLRSLTAQE